MATRQPAKKGTRPRSAEEPPPAGGDALVAAMAASAIGGGIARPLLGMQRVFSTLGSALATGHCPHAWIFHGPSGIGKCTAAMRLAALLVDPQSTSAERATCSPLTDSHSADLLRAGTHPDVHLIRADLAGSSADRELRDRKQVNIPIQLLREHMIGGTSSSGAPIEGPIFKSSVLGAGKVFIIDEAERLETDGQNVLLKVLEEPPPGTVIVLVTSSLDRLLPTIRSRCQSLGFSPLGSEHMKQWLDMNLGEVTGTHRAFIEQYAAGSPGAAVTAVAMELQALHAKIVPMMDRLERGECPLELSDVMNDFASEAAEAAVKANENASKEAANRRAAGVVFSVIGAEVRRRMHAARSQPSRLRYWARVPMVIADTERMLQANVNQKLALAEFVAAWAAIGSAAGSETGTRGAASAGGQRA
ncbi:MAG: AAA family ATPase [Planctomycetes bacterium]|nr:AAA family ATPase [Planctomycetota bacterium]